MAADGDGPRGRRGGLLVFMRRVPLPSEGLYLLRVLARRLLAAQPQS